MKDAIDVPAVVQPAEPQQALALRQAQSPAERGLFGTNEPVAIIQKATEAATALKAVVKQQGLISNISGKEYPKVEAWTLLGTLIGVFPVNVWTRKLEDGWEARVEARTKDGSVIGAAEAQCLRSERNWEKRDDFALRSMAQTRATAKCLRMPLGFVMSLAGYEATPAEEIPHEQGRAYAGQAQSRQMGSTPHSEVKTPPRGNSSGSSPGQKATTSPPPERKAPKEAIFADASTRDRVITKLTESNATAAALDYCRAAGLLMPNEVLTDLPLRWVPLTHGQMRLFHAAIGVYVSNGPAEKPYPPNGEPEPAKKSPPAKEELNAEAPKSTQAAKAKDPEWFFDVICPIPNKGQRKADYDASPDTIRSLYHAMKTGDEAAQKRLWGFARHWKPEARTQNGRTYQPSKADFTFREALDAFCEWSEKHEHDTQQAGTPEEQSPFNDDSDELPL